MSLSESTAHPVLGFPNVYPMFVDSPSSQLGQSPRTLNSKEKCCSLLAVFSPLVGIMPSQEGESMRGLCGDHQIPLDPAEYLYPITPVNVGQNYNYMSNPVSELFSLWVVLGTPPNTIQ